jgi:hypothetical protein
MKLREEPKPNEHDRRDESDTNENEDNQDNQNGLNLIARVSHQECAHDGGDGAARAGFLPTFRCVLRRVLKHLL